MARALRPTVRTLRKVILRFVKQESSVDQFEHLAVCLLVTLALVIGMAKLGNPADSSTSAVRPLSVRLSGQAIVRGSPYNREGTTRLVCKSHAKYGHLSFARMTAPACSSNG